MQNQIKEKVAAALKNCKRKPDYFILLDTKVWNYNSILEIPIIYTTEIISLVDDFNCPFIPCYIKYTGDEIIDVRRFRKEYDL